ncbi:DUF389 domain-containing protein [Isoptericola croceus]|uniref:DUF389 domain-containing protein n=1 Tax=Isoptericola croceus TaxID=3031406 RepID=UPI0023F6AA70|nr:DUF389 domain-containing protein [Isoptericola croceus]
MDPVVRGTDLLRNPARLVNPSTVGGAVAVGIGLVLVLVPAISLGLTETVVGIGLLVSGGNDLWNVVRRRRARVTTRAVGVLRGLASVALAVVFLFTGRDALTTTLVLGGAYLLFRSLVSLVLAVLGRDRTRRAPRLASGGVGLLLAVLVIAAPEIIADWFTVMLGLAALGGGAVALAHGYRVAAGTVATPEGMYPSLTEILWSWVEHVDVGTERRTRLADQLYLERPELAAKQAAWWVMLVLSVCIATLAVLQDSTAVVIGAMLVAPLMTPILGLAAAVVSGWARRAVGSLVLIVAGATVAVAIAFVISSWVPAVVPFDTNSQISSRVNPTLLDMLVAVAAGAAGAFATVDRRVAPSIAGVAIAVALVPPLAVVGVALGASRPGDAAGALLLFSTNFVSIVLSASVVFVLAGLTNAQRLRRDGRRVLLTLTPFAAAALLILIPLLLTTDGLLSKSADGRAAHSAVHEWLGRDSTLSPTNVTVGDATVTVELAGPSDDLPPLEDLQAALKDALDGGYAVEVAVTPVVTQHLPASE